MPCPYTRLTLTERQTLAQWRDAGIPMNEIAERFGREKRGKDA